MQYLLTEEEYNNLKTRRAYEIRMSKDKLQKLCTKICDTMPVDWGWGGKGQEKNIKPWGCIITAQKRAEEEGDHCHEWYCDECPVQDICPKEYKSWSK